MYILILCLASFAFGYFIRKLSERKPVKKDDRIHIIEPKKRNMEYFTFEEFWFDFHYINSGRKLDKQHCKNLWKNCNFSDRHKKAIQEITKTDKTAFEYLHWKLYEVTTK